MTALNRKELPDWIQPYLFEEDDTTMATLSHDNRPELLDAIRKHLPVTPRPPAHNAKFDGPTHVCRIPLNWERDELVDRLEQLHSALQHAESQIAEAFERGQGKISNRFEKLAEFVADLRAIFPAGDAYDLLKDQLP